MRVTFIQTPYDMNDTAALQAFIDIQQRQFHCGDIKLNQFQQLLLLSQQQMTDSPTHNDVLLGRGVATNRHPGNENFRSIVNEHVVSTK